MNNILLEDSLQMYLEFLLTLRFEVHPASVISGLEIWHISQTPRFYFLIVAEINFPAISFFVSLKFKSRQPFVASLSWQ